MVGRIFALALLAASPAAAQQQCLERGAALEGIAETGGQLVGRGMANGMPILVYRRGDGAWMMVLDNGVALCLLANGTDWENFPIGERT